MVLFHDVLNVLPQLLEVQIFFDGFLKPWRSSFQRQRKVDHPGLGHEINLILSEDIPTKTVRKKDLQLHVIINNQVVKALADIAAQVEDVIHEGKAFKAQIVVITDFIKNILRRTIVQLL